jgi:hypothetical protein
MGAYVIIDVNFTLIFPKAWPYAIVYYNYSVTAHIASKLLPYPMYLNSTAFSIRFEIDQVTALQLVRLLQRDHIHTYDMWG